MSVACSTSYMILLQVLFLDLIIHTLAYNTISLLSLARKSQEVHLEIRS